LNEPLVKHGIEIRNGTISCPECRSALMAAQPTCPRCDWVNILASEDALERRRAREVELEELIQKAKANGDWTELPPDAISKAAASIILTTAIGVANREVEREIEILSAECAYGMNLFRDVFAAVRDIVGGRSVATQKVLRDARKTCLAELKREALMVGADAVIAVDLDYSEFSGGQKGGMLFLVASGTAVKLK